MSPTPPTGPLPGPTRPRVEGDREREVLVAALDVLAEVGYDRLTMDAVAARAKASKATLYRRWTGKASLVVDALRLTRPPPEVPDTGTLRGDLEALFIGIGGLLDPRAVVVFGSVLTALTRDEAFAEAFRRDVVGPRRELSRLVWQRARDRGELREDADLDLLEPAVAGIVLHRVFLLGESPDPGLVTRVIDQVVLPAATRPDPAPRHRTAPPKDRT